MNQSALLQIALDSVAQRFQQYKGLPSFDSGIPSDQLRSELAYRQGVSAVMRAFLDTAESLVGHAMEVREAPEQPDVVEEGPIPADQYILNHVSKTQDP